MLHVLATIHPHAKPRPRFSRRGRGRSGAHAYMPREYRDWQALFRSFLPRLSNPLRGELGVSMVFGTPSGHMRPDLDNAAGAVLDAMQPDTIANDRDVVELRARVVKARRCAILVDVYPVLAAKESEWHELAA